MTEEDMVKNGANGSAANILKSKAPIKNNQISWARLLAGMGGTQWQMTEGHGWPSRRKRGAEGTLCVGRRGDARALPFPALALTAALERLSARCVRSGVCRCTH